VWGWGCEWKGEDIVFYLLLKCFESYGWRARLLNCVKGETPCTKYINCPVVVIVRRNVTDKTKLRKYDKRFRKRVV